jgi:predicted dehydrogenase
MDGTTFSYSNLESSSKQLYYIIMTKRTTRRTGSESFATESSPLASSAVANISSYRRFSNKFAIVHISSLFIYIIFCMTAAGLLLFTRSNYHRNLPDGDANYQNSNVRRDIVENFTPEKHTVVLTPPPMYLDSHSDNIDRGASNLRSSLLGREEHRHDNPKDHNTPTPLRWGILGAGRIAHDFASALVSSGCNVTAVAAMYNYNGEKHLSALSRAESFATKFSIPNYYSTYEELAQDMDVDIVYVATTNQNHLNPTLLMLQAGKNVLVEKPTAVTYDEAKLMYDEAEKRGLFLMTNHWTRFFPLVKYLRTTFLELQSPMDEASEVSTKPSSTAGRQWKPPHPSHSKQYNLGKVLAMHGDFGFTTPLNPSDRFLNRTLGGGVTLDVGCYLVELALLAAYDHHQSSRSADATEGKMRRKLTSDELQPDQVTATGHGMYSGLEFPVDVESSFSIRWGGNSYGIWNGECDVDENGGDMTATSLSSAKRRGCHLAPRSRYALSDESDAADDVFTMVASFQASFRRPSTFEVEYVFENGRVVLHGPGNCPNEMTIYENEPYGPLIRETTVSFKLPLVDLSPFGRSNYPRAEGFVYVIDRIEECMMEEGVPGRSEDSSNRGGSGCLELEENSIEEQLATVQITERVLEEMNYFG